MIIMMMMMMMNKEHKIYALEHCFLIYATIQYKLTLESVQQSVTIVISVFQR